MKAKSMKLRTLITLGVLYKHTDENHRLNTAKLNKFLAPYGLQCKKGVLSDTVKRLQEFGVEVGHKGEWEKQGFWIVNRPLSDDVLNKLIFAVSSNPLLSSEQADEILSDLKPLVTVYQEPELKRTVDAVSAAGVCPALFEVYRIVRKAIQDGRRVNYAESTVRFDEETKSVVVEPHWGRNFTPKNICREGDQLYMVGYDHFLNEPRAVNLKDVVEIKPSFKHAKDAVEYAYRILDDIDPVSLIPGKARKIIYTGPVVLRCRGQYIGELYEKFGPPSGPVTKTKRGYTAYPVQNAEISPETLLWMTGMPQGHEIRIVGPEAVKRAVETYYMSCANTVLNPNFSQN